MSDPVWRVTVVSTVSVEAATKEQAIRTAIEEMRDGEFTVISHDADVEMPARRREYIDPAEAASIRVFCDGSGWWSIHAVGRLDGEYTEQCWNRDGDPDARLTLTRALELVPQFVAEVGLPEGLPVEVVPMPSRKGGSR